MFAGPFSASTARGSASTAERTRLRRPLDELTHASLVTADTSGPETRYRLLEMVRRFALDRLRERGELRRRTTASPTTSCVGPGDRRGATASWRPGLLHDLVAAFDDIAEALRWCTAHDSDAQRALALCAMLWGIVHQGRAEDIADLARRTLARWPNHDLGRCRWWPRLPPLST